MSSAAARTVRRVARPHRALVAAIRGRLRAQADPGRAPILQAYMKSAMPYLGMQLPAVYAACREVSREHVVEDFHVWRATVLTLWREARYREERYAAIELTGQRPYERFQRLTVLPMYREMIVTGAWWDLVDWIATRRLGTLLVRHPTPMARHLRAWATGRDVWLRRASILSQIKLKADTDRRLLYDCIEASIDSREFFLRKAIGWALREHAKTDGPEILRYVDARRTRLSPLSVREALKGLRPR